MAKKKQSLSDRLTSINKTKENKQPVHKPIVQVAKVRGKQGRPTYKEEGVEYDRIFADIPKSLKAKLDIIKVTKFREKYKTHSELIMKALEEFVEKYE